MLKFTRKRSLRLIGIDVHGCLLGINGIGFFEWKPIPFPFPIGKEPLSLPVQQVIRAKAAIKYIMYRVCG